MWRQAVLVEPMSEPLSAERLYRAYWQRRWDSGDPVPQWEALPPKKRDWWEGVADEARYAIRPLLALLPSAEGEYSYIEARVGSENYRKESHFIRDQRPNGYVNRMANEWLAEVAALADVLRDVVPTSVGSSDD